MPLQDLSDKDFVRALQNRYDDGTLQFGWREEGLEFRHIYATLYSEDMTHALRIELSEHYLTYAYVEVKWGQPAEKYELHHCGKRTIYSPEADSLWRQAYPKVMAGYNGMIAAKVNLLQLAG